MPEEKTVREERLAKGLCEACSEPLSDDEAEGCGGYFVCVNWGCIYYHTI